ncbi:MAG: hypothetical protein KBF88_06895 [Polyangiaceae bacterium]|nr:hypothetical protein [Polyangiaceae bacterium]
MKNILRSALVCAFLGTGIVGLGLSASGCKKDENKSAVTVDASAAPKASAAMIGLDDVLGENAMGGGGQASLGDKMKDGGAEEVTNTLPTAPVKLISGGADPKTALRYKFTGSGAEKALLDVKFSFAMELVGIGKQPPMNMPTIRSHITFTPIKLEKDLLRYSFVIQSMDVLPDAQAPKQIIEPLKGELSKAKGISGAAAVDTRGNIRDFQASVPENIEPQIAQMLTMIQEQTNQLVVPFPEEAVGVGGSWQKQGDISANGVKVHQEITYTLDKMEGDALSVRVVLKQAGAGGGDMPGPGGSKMRLESIVSNGNGTNNVNLKSLVPSSATNKVENATNALILAEGRSQKVSSKISATIQIKPEK